MTDVEIFIISGISIAMLFIVFIISFLLINQKRHFQYLKQERELENKFTQALLQSQIEIQEQTLQHLSSELHDNLGQVASLIKINLHTLQLDDLEKASIKLQDTRELTRQLILDIKSLSVSLNSDRVMQSGLMLALETEIERINKTEVFTATFEKEDGLPSIANDKAIILYRMIQETLNNTVKHSMAQNIHLKISTRENFIIFTLTDDGKGFNVADKMKSGGAGLYNLKKRATLIKANLSVKSSPGNGTSITIEFPNIYGPNTSSEASPGG